MVGVVQSERIDGLHFETSDAAFLHRAHLAFELRLGDGGAEPPPAHHDFAVFGRLLECPLQARQVTGLIGILYDSATKPASERGQHQNSYNEAMSVRMNHRLDAWEREAGLSYSTQSLNGANMPFPALPKNPTAGTPKSFCGSSRSVFLSWSTHKEGWET